MQNKWIWIFVASGLIAVAGALWWLVGPVTVTAAAPVRGPAVEAIYATGSVEPSVMLPIAPRTAGRIIELNVDEGGEVRKGQILARLDDADLDSTVAELAARARYAQSQHERSQDLVRRGFIARSDLDRTRADRDAADASLKRARAQRDFMALTAPADGSILKRDGEIGQFIPAGQAVFFLSCCAPLRVTADVDEEDIARVRVGQKVLLHADAVPGRILEGDVAEITPKGDPIARSYRVRIRLTDPALLKVGMTVDANLIVAERQDALLVPTSAVQNNAVWVVADGKLHRQPVRTGVAGTARTEVIEGLTADARVVESPSAELREGRHARIRAPAAVTPQAGMR
jgi:RND family efflux transporter MFP subunit